MINLPNNNIILIINNTKPPRESRFYGYFVQERITSEGESLILYKIEENFYPHPNAPENALIPIMERSVIGEYKPHHENYPAVALFKYCQDNLVNILNNNVPISRF